MVEAASAAAGLEPSHKIKIASLVASVAFLLIATSAAATAPVESDCGLPKVKWMGELQHILSKRAVDAVNFAAVWRKDRAPALELLIDPAAEFSLGSGDASVALGVGIAGARAIAKAMSAETYRFLGWDYIPRSVDDPCGAHKVDVEFIDAQNKRLFPVTFEFEAGRIVSVKGWTRSFKSGPLTRVVN